jgi:hypothetical protein
VQWEKTDSRFYVQESSDRYYTEKYLCHGYETRCGIEEMLRREHVAGREYLQFRIRESSWPGCRMGIGGDEEETKYLCQVSTGHKVQLFADAELMEQDLYGCPTAKILQESGALRNCSVEIVAYE